jgi:FkbM family methyltransferase
LISEKCIIDVGANSGEFAIPAATNNPEHTVIAFEPVEHLRNQILDQARIRGLRNLVVKPQAISDTSGTARLGIALSGDQGTSSLLQFNEDNLRNDPYWISRTDLHHDEYVEVETTRLDEILTEMGISEVSFIKIDAQGFDLRVLDSLGLFIPKAGMFEVPTTEKRALYVDEPTLFDALQYLQEKGLQVWEIKPNDPATAEVNVFFTSPESNLYQVETQLRLTEIDIYSGKKFWLVSGSTEAQAESNAIERFRGQINPELNREIGVLESQLSIQSRKVEQLEVELLNQALEVQRLDVKSQGYDQVLNSRTWRYTKLFRTLFRPIAESTENGID